MRVDRVPDSRIPQTTERPVQEHDAGPSERALLLGSVAKVGAVGHDREPIENHAYWLNETLRTFDKKLRFRVHESTDRLIVRVVDAETQEVLREIPPEEILELVAHIEKTVGLIIDERI